MKEPAMDDSYDVIIVGGRCSVSPTAMLLARRGRRVLLLDRADMPSDTLSTHNLVQPGLVMLRRWGLLDRLLEPGCPSAVTTRVTLGDATFELPIEPLAGITATCAPRRVVLDDL